MDNDVKDLHHEHLHT